VPTDDDAMEAMEAMEATNPRPTSLQSLPSPLSLQSLRSRPPGQPGTVSNTKAEGPIRGFGNADAGSACDVARPDTDTFFNPERCPIQRMTILLGVDAKGLGQFARTVGEPAVVGMDGRAEAATSHDIDAFERLDRPNQYRCRKPGFVRDGVEAPVDAVNAVDISDAGRAEHGFVALRAADAFGTM